jgi:hypothetical protein
MPRVCAHTANMETLRCFVTPRDGVGIGVWRRAIGSLWNRGDHRYAGGGRRVCQAANEPERASQSQPAALAAYLNHRLQHTAGALGGSRVIAHRVPAAAERVRSGFALRSDRPKQPRMSLRASVGSTEASDGPLARVGVVGPKRASLRAIRRTTRLAPGLGRRPCRVYDRRLQGRSHDDHFDHTQR